MRMLSTQSPIIGPESTDYTPWTFSETDTTYKPHPDGFDHSRDRIREAKKSILGDLLTGSASKRTMDKLCEQFPGGLAELEDMQKDNKEHKEDMASDRKLSTNISTFLIVATFMFCTIGSQFLGLWMIERAGTSPKEESS
jgi:hypothetical protein